LQAGAGLFSSNQKGGCPGLNKSSVSLWLS
jgi:hypothetical protein